MAQLKLPEIEKEIQEYWNTKNIINEVVSSRRGNKNFYFCQGPPFTSGKAHVGHAWNTAIKDWVLRYKTMRGYDVFRRAGWDMHGLPIEVKVEETVLGSRTKKEIEAYGIENFITECKKFAINNMNSMTEQLKRLGAWLDWDDPYMTLDKGYMESVWFGIKKAHEKDLLYEDEQVIHWCPRCETAVAGYEVKDEYKEVSDPSVYVKAKIRDGEGYLLIWTTTPWTLPANTAIAVHPHYDYVRISHEGSQLILVKERLPFVFKEGEYTVLEELKGIDLKGIEYEPILDIDIQKDIKRRVVTAPDLVTLEDGTGLVHIAPGHGEEDFKVGKEHGLDSLSPVDESGKLMAEPYKGIYIRDANPIITRDLKEKGRLLKEETIHHRYPHCWRCKTPLLLRTTRQWFLAVSKIREKLLEKNNEIRWVPDWIGSGRFENWLSNARDWCISRQRYWNTPLPIWKCECGNIEVIGSIEELKSKSASPIDTNADDFDLHKPYIDRVKLKCPCGKEMGRVDHVLDVWIDSGSASWANLRYPQDDASFNRLYPPDFITEGSDQTRGWFYSLLVMSVVSFDSIGYKTVLYHGFTLDSEGRKMSKSLGNVVDPMEVIDRNGADVFRFYMLSANVPWGDLCFSWDGLASVERTLNILWNVYSFAETYMKLDNFNPKKDYELALATEDLWMLSKLNTLIEEVTKAAENYRPHEYTRPINDYILEVSRWYVKLVRDRVWIEGDDPRKISVYYTLYRILKDVSILMAPVTPHLSEHIYRELNAGRSIHLENWPGAEKERMDAGLEKDMEIVKQIVECVNAARQTTGIKLRWPIPAIYVAMKDVNGSFDPAPYEAMILKLCNAKKLELKSVETGLTVKPNLAIVGPKFKKDAARILQTLKTVDAKEVRKAIDETGKYNIEGVETPVEEPDLIFETKMPEDMVAEEFKEGMVYIDSKLSPELLSESMARELIRRIQEMRKQMNLPEMDAVNACLVFPADSGLKAHAKEHREYIEKETRSRLSFDEPCGEGHTQEWEIEKEKVSITIDR